MQKTPILPILNCPVKLPAGAWAIISSKPFEQGDDEVTYLHYHDLLELGYCLDGNGVFLIGGKILQFTAGDRFLIAAGEPHLAQSLPKTRSCWLWLYLKADQVLAEFPELPSLNRFAGEEFCNRFRPPEFPEIIRGFETLRAVLAAPESRFLRRKLQACAIELTIALEEAGLPCRNTGDCRAALERVVPALTVLHREYRSPLASAALARSCSLSENQFRRVFQRATGRSPRGYLNALRISVATAALRENRSSIAEIAQDCGYPTLSSFYRQFHKETGISPCEFRRRFAGESHYAFSNMNLQLSTQRKKW